MIKYRALKDVEVGKRVVNMSGEIVVTRLPEGSRADGSLKGGINDIPAKCRHSNGLENTMSLPDYYPCRIDKDLRDKVLGEFRKARPAWTGGYRAKDEGGSNVANNEKKIANWTKWLTSQEELLKAAKKKKDAKKIAKFQGEVDFAVAKIEKLKGAAKTAPKKETKADGEVFVMLKYA